MELDASVNNLVGTHFISALVAKKYINISHKKCCMASWDGYCLFTRIFCKNILRLIIRAVCYNRKGWLAYEKLNPVVYFSYNKSFSVDGDY